MHKILQSSSLIETAPVGGPAQGLYINGVVKIETSLPPLDLLHQLKSLEKFLGRRKTIPNGPRVIDIDILLYNNITMTSDELTIPHPRMWERAFVTQPLKEIAPELIL